MLAYTTVKWYNRQIFDKLGVQTREQAVERAYALHLLTSSDAPPTNAPVRLPAQLTPLIGREDELADLSRALSNPQTRFLTLLASGGMGKTRLALTVAERLAVYFADGVYFVPLAPLVTEQQLIPAIADAIGLQFFPDSRPPKQQLLDFLRTRTMLLVLDNFEHLLDDAPEIADILSAGSGVKVLVTSRERLNVTGETVYMLGGLPYPRVTSTENALGYSAVQLFVQCARRADARFAANDMESIARITQLVEGMPLALELAAAWVGTLLPDEIAAEISRSADFLHTTMRNAPERLRSIRAVFEATWRRLSADERQTFRRLAIFRGGCTREAAQAVTGASLSTIAALVDKALLRRSASGARFEIHELLRQYAEEQLLTAGEADAVKTAYRHYFAGFVQSWGRALKTPKQLEALDVLEADLDNLRAAMRLAIERATPDAVEPFTDLWFFYEIRARNVEGRAVWQTAIDALAGQESLALGKLLLGQAIFYERFYDYEQERRLAERSIAIFRRLNAVRELPFALAAYGVGTVNTGDGDKAAAAWNESLEMVKQDDDPWVMSILLVCFGAFSQRESIDEAKRLFTQAYALIQATGNEWGVSFALWSLGFIAIIQGDYHEALRLHEMALASARRIRHMNNVSISLNGLCRIAFLTGDLEAAKRYSDEMLKVSRSIGDRHATYWATTRLAQVATVEGNDALACRYFQDALAMFPDLTDSLRILNLAVSIVPFLMRSNAQREALLVISFLRGNALWDILIPQEQTELQLILDQLRDQLPAEMYDAAWLKGQSIAQDELIAEIQQTIQNLSR